MSERIFYTDTELTKRWNCSKVTLWRMRQRGELPKPSKFGSVNATPISIIHSVEHIKGWSSVEAPAAS